MVTHLNNQNNQGSLTALFWSFLMIHYEKHPVSKERKAELRAKGLKIIDEKFKPKDDTSGEPSTKTKSVKSDGV